MNPSNPTPPTHTSFKHLPPNPNAPNDNAPHRRNRRPSVFRLDVADEAAVAPLLDTLAAEFGADVAIGSYPVTGQRDGARLLLALESKRPAALAPAAARLRELLPPGALLGEQRDVARLLGDGGGNGGNGGSGSPARRPAAVA